MSPHKRIAPLRHYQADLQQPEAFSSTGNEQFIGGVQSIKAFPESVEEINIFSLDVTRKERQGEKKENKQRINEWPHLHCMQIRLI